MRKFYTLVSLMLMSTVAFAQGAAPGSKPADTKAAPAKPAEAAPKAAEKPAAPPAGGDMGMMAPKPADELQQLKGMVGTWKCEGKFTMAGKEMKEKSTAKFKWDLDNFFIAGDFEAAKSKENPKGFKGHSMYGWDGKQFTEMGVDSMGGMMMATSKGWQGDTMEWTGKAHTMGQDFDTKTTITRKGDKEVHILGQMGAGPQAMTEEMTCKK